MQLEIIYQDDFLVAINKPHGLLVHRSSIAANVDQFALQLLRDQLNKHVYPVHRLDRKTAGILLFALQAETAKKIQTLFKNQEVTKEYHAIVRGFFPENIDLDYDIKNDRGNVQNARTVFKRLTTSEIPIPFGKHSTSRYSLVEASPKTGRQHQIRKHLAHLRHPIIADRPHGCNKQNKLFKEKWNMTTMMLNAVKLELSHPITEEAIRIKCAYSQEFIQTKVLLNLNEKA